MTGAYAQEGPWSRGRGYGGERGRHGDERERHGEGRCGGHRGGRSRYGGQSDLEALAAWVLNRAGKGSPRGHRRPTPEELEKLEELIALRRMRGFGGPGPRGHRGRGRGRARRGDVRLAVLRLLAEEPRNGYQLMQAIEERSGGSWRPSPGSMYPTLAQLEDEGLIRSAQAEGSREFEITDIGREQLATRSGEPDPWTPADDRSEHAMAELGPLVIGIGKAVWQVASVGTEEQRARALELLDETRRGLYGILAEGSTQDDETDARPDDGTDAPDDGETGDTAHDEG